MNLTAILAELYRRLDYQSAPAATVTTRLTAYVNECQQEILSEPGIAVWLARREPAATFASVAAQQVYGLPVARIEAVTEHTNNRRLDMRSLDWWRRAEPNPVINQGAPSVWVPLGFLAVAMQPTAATGLWAASSSASDTTQTVRLETVRTGNLPSSGSLTLNGTTRVQLGALTDHVEISKLYLSAVGVGAVSLYDAASNGNVLAAIPIGQTFSRYLGLALWPTPQTAITYYVDADRDVPDLVNGTDEPPFPSAFHRVLVDGALWREYVKTDDNRAAIFQARYRTGVAHLRYAVTCPADFLPSRGGRMTERSHFGGAFPADHW